MQKRAGLLSVFFFFTILSLILIFLFRQQLLPLGINAAEVVTNPLQRSFYSAFGGLLVRAGSYDRSAAINQVLAKKIVDQQELQKESKALRDQYDQEALPAKSLLPARVIGMKSFIPGISLPEEVILDKGTNQHIRVGQTVILRDNVVGKIKAISANRSLISLIPQKTQSFTATTVESKAVGVLRGKGSGGLVLENVVLSDSLKKNDIVVTKGEQDINGTGYPPNLVIGRITSIDKKPSDLFQSAEVESLVNFAALEQVFIMIE
jgi:rod shape-determining protein MreC